MSSFTKEPSVSFNHPKPGNVTTNESFTFYLTDEGGEYVIIPEKFGSDGVSAPKKLYYILSNYDRRTIKAGILHDFLYAHRTIMIGKHRRLCTQREADKIFFKAILVGGLYWINTPLIAGEKLLGMKWLASTVNRVCYVWRKYSWRVRCMLGYMALRTFGWIAFYRHRFNEWRAK